MDQSGNFRMFHWLKRNLRTDAPQSILFIDTETDVQELIATKVKCEEHTLRLWCGYYTRIEDGKQTRQEWLHGTSVESFWERIYNSDDNFRKISDSKRVLWVFAHNLGFDATILKMWKQFDEGKLILRTGECEEGKEWTGQACIAGPPTFIKCKINHTRSTLCFVDTLNWFRCSLAKLGESFGIKKLEMPKQNDPSAKWIDYCQRDVEIIKVAILELISMVRNEDLGHFATTAPGQAWNAYRHKFMSDKFILISGNKRQLEIERDGYFGGTVKNYFIGNVVAKYPMNDLNSIRSKTAPYEIAGPVHVLDVQSFWPSIMREIDLPRAIISMQPKMTHKELELACEVYNVVAKVKISSADIDFPKRFEQYSMLCRGNFWTTLCTPELRLALNQKCVESIGEVVIYKTANLFREYVDYFWDIRVRAKESGNKAKEELAKLMLNSLLGKFGQRAIRWKDCNDVYPGTPWGEWSEWSQSTNSRENYRSLAWLCQIKVTDGENDNSFPAIPAHVTSEGRVRMRQYEHIAGESNCLYSDTDSLHVNNEGMFRLRCAGLIKEGEIGKFAVKGTFETASYYGMKAYSLNGINTIAGLSKNAVKVADNMYEQPNFPSLQQLFADYKHMSMIVPYQKRLINYSTLQGRVGFDGRVKPLNITIPDE